MITADKKFLSAIDEKADKLKADIIGAKDAELKMKGKTYFQIMPECCWEYNNSVLINKIFKNNSFFLDMRQIF